MIAPAQGCGRGRGRGDQGGASLAAIACAGVLLMIGAALGVVSALVVDHRTAQAAADLSALAGAGDVVGGDPCGRAAAVARANGAELTACAVSGLEVSVAVLVTGPRWMGQRSDLVARARAGPATGSTPQ